jgi:hypothetical protein
LANVVVVSSRVRFAYDWPRMFARCAAAVSALLGVVTASSAARADENLPEAIIEENITDIDANESGTLEIDYSGVLLAPHHAGVAGAWNMQLEAEWRALDRLGLAAELATGAKTDGFAPKAPSLFGGRAAASYVVVRDFERQLFLQAEGTARFDAGDDPNFADLSEPALPYTAGLRWATRVRAFTLRAAATGEGGGSFAHAPVRGSFVLLWDFPIATSYVDVGTEAIADWARTSPFVMVPEVLVLAPMFGRHVRFGLGAPLTLGAKGDDGAWGIAFRIVAEED